MKKMWKRFVSLLLACTLLAGMLPLSASAAEKPEKTDWISEIIKDLEEQEYKDTMPQGTAPMQVGSSDVFMYMYQKGSWVTDGEGQSSYVNDLIVIFQPGSGDGNHSIPDYTQQNPPEWSESKPSAVYFADGVTGIGNYAFASQPSLNNVVFQDASDLTYIGQRAFYDDDNAVFTDEGNGDGTTLDLSGVTTMGEYAFYNCDKLTGVELGNMTAVETVEGKTEKIENKIPNHAFTSTGVQSITVPSGIKEVGEYAFYDCPLNKDPYISLQEGLATIGDYAFGKNDAAPNTSMIGLTIPSSVVNIGDHAFYNYKGLQTVTVLGEDNGGAGASALTHVGDAAFGDADHNAYSTTTTIQDAVNPEIEYTGLVGTQFYLPKELEKNDKLFVNGETCYTGDITPMQYVDTEPADCINAGYDIYKTTFTGAASGGEPIVMTYHYPIPALGHDYGPITEVKRTCENDNYFVQFCERKNCPNEGDAVGSLWKSGIGMGLFDPDTDQKLTDEELQEWREKFQEHKGHTWVAKSVVNPTIEAGKTTTLYYSCTNPDHGETDRYSNPFSIDLTGKTINALTTQSPDDIANQLVGFTNYGKVELVSPSDEPFGTEGITYLDVKYTMIQDKSQNWPVFTTALEGEPDSASGTATLRIKVNVTKDVLDLSDVSILPNMVNVGSPATVKAEGFDPATPGEVEYFANGRWTTTQPYKEGEEYKVRVKFTYNESMYDLPEVGDLEYPGEGYTLMQGEDSVWVEHSFVVALHQITAQVRAISGLTYDETEKDTLEVIGLKEGWHVSVTATKQGSSEPAATWEYTGKENEENMISGLSLTDAGTYNVQVVFTYPDNPTYEKKIQNLEVHIDHKQVKKPVAPQNMKYEPVSKERNGFEGQASEDWKFVDEGGYTHVGINAGKYTAKATLTNENYRWENTDEAVRDITIPWEILKRELYAPSINQPVYGYKYGSWVNPLVNPNSDYSFEPDKGTNTVKLVYIGNKDTDDYDQEAAVAYTAANAYHTNRGRYPVTVTLNESKNYVWYGNEPSGLEWTINPATLTLPQIEAQNATYTGEPYAADTWVSVAAAELPDDVKSKGYQYSNDASFRSPSSTAPTNAGTYYVRQNYTYNNQNYIAQIPYASFTINKATATMTFSPTEVTEIYTAEGTDLQQVTVDGLVDADKDNPASEVYNVTYTYKYRTDSSTTWEEVNTETKIEEPSSFKFTDVGEYQITATFSSNNYTATPAIYTLTIEKANAQKITLTRAGTNKGTWKPTEKTYTTTYGSEKTFTVTGTAELDEPVISYAVKKDSEKGPDGNTADVLDVDSGSGVVTINQAGTATITVTAADTANVAGTSVDYTVTVKKATPTVNTGLEGDELTVAYTGNPITDTEYNKATVAANVVEGAAKPTGDITYTFYTDLGCSDENKVTNGGGKDGNIPIAVGTYYMKATYPGDKNYLPAESKVVTVIVTEAQLTVDAKGHTGIYNGQPHDPASITVKGVDGTSFEEDDYTVSYIEKGSDGEAKPDVDNPNWNPGLKVKDVADSGDYWIKVVIDGDDSSYAPYVGEDPITVTVNPKPLQIEKEVTARKPYDGTKEAIVNIGELKTGVDGETVKVTDTRAEYNSPNVEQAETITITYKLTEGPNTDLDNYSVSTDGGEITDGLGTETVTEVGDTKVGIDPAPITVAINDQKKVYDGSAPTVSNVKDTDWKVTDGEIYQLVPDTDDDLGIALSIASGSDAKNAGAYAITGKWTNKNYAVTFTGSWKGEEDDPNNNNAGTYTITPRPIKVEIGNAEGFYGDAPDVTMGDKVILEDVTNTEDVSEDGLVQGEDIYNVFTGLTLRTNATNTSPVGENYEIYPVNNDSPILSASPTQLGNYNVTFTQNGTYTVKPRPITITISDAESDYGCDLAQLTYSKTLSEAYTDTNKGVVFVGDDETDLKIVLFTTAKKGSDAGTYPISGTVTNTDLAKNYAITWKGQTPFTGEGEPDSTKATYTVEKAELTVEAKQTAVYAQYGQETANPLTFTNASTGEEITVADSNYETLENAVTYTLNPPGSLTMETENKAEGKFTVNVTDTTVTVEVNVAETDNFKAATMITYDVYTSASGSLTVDLPFADLTYTSEEQKLLTGAPTLPDDVVIRYKLGEKGTWTKYSDEAPNNWQSLVGTGAGDYTVYWETKAGGNYNASSGHETTEIKKADLSATYTGLNDSEVILVLSEMGDTYTIPLDLTGNEGYTHSNGDGVTFLSGNTDVAIAKNSTATLELRGVAGEAKITINCPGDNNYNPGTFTFTVKVTDQKAEIKYNITGATTTYNGQPQTIAVNVTAPASGATVMYQDEDGNYTLSEPPAYTDVKEGGYPIKFQITAPGYETVTGEATLKIEPKDIKECQVEGIAASYTFVNKPIEPKTVEVVDDSVILKEDTDYTITYGANTEVGEDKGSVIIKGTGNYTGEVTVYFNIAPVDGSSGMTASIDPAYGTYDPDGNTATVTVTHQTGTDSHEVTLTAENASYTITATDLVTGDPITERGATGTGNTLTFTKPAIYDITLKLTGDHQGEFHLSYTLLPLSNEDGGLTLTVDDETQKVFTYGDRIPEEEATITVTADGNIVTDQCTLNYEYTGFDQTTVSGDYSPSVLKNAGVYTVTATPTEGSTITGTGTFTFLILQRDLADAILDVDDADLVFNHDEKEPDVTVSVTGDPVQGEDYTVTYYNNVNASDEAKAVVTAKGNNFTGSQTAEFTIAPKEITADMVQDIPAQYYTGNEVIPPVTITDGNYTLILGYDYTTACTNKGPGAATVTITGTGNYTETTTKDFVIKSEGAPEPSERFDLVVTPSQWTWGGDLTNLDLSVTFGTDKELTLGTEYTLSINNEVYGDAAGETKEQAIEAIKSLKPGEYTITATGVGAYNGSTDTETVTIQKIQPEVTVTATPNSLSGGGKVTLTLKGEKLPNGTDLKTLLSVTAKNDNDVTLEDLHIQWPEDGSLTAELTLPNTNETYTFTLRFAENDYYESASSTAMVVVGQQTSGGGGGSDPGDQPADPDDTGVSDWLNTKDHLAYLAGYPGGAFGPDQNMTRAEAAQMFYNLLLEKDVEITVEFEDVPADAWYAKPVNTLASLGILSGVGNGRFDPERSITRAEFTVIAMKFANTSGGGVNIFSDVNEDDWFYSAVVDSTQYGWINGYPDGTFRPEATISRAEVTVIVNHMLGRAADRPYVIAHEEELNTFGDVNRGHWGYFHVAEATNAHEYHTEDGTESWTGLS